MQSWVVVPCNIFFESGEITAFVIAIEGDLYLMVIVVEKYTTGVM